MLLHSEAGSGIQSELKLALPQLLIETIELLIVNLAGMEQGTTRE